jgi:hypothetical protein
MRGAFAGAVLLVAAVCGTAIAERSSPYQPPRSAPPSYPYGICDTFYTMLFVRGSESQPVRQDGAPKLGSVDLAMQASVGVDGGQDALAIAQARMAVGGEGEQSTEAGRFVRDVATRLWQRLEEHWRVALGEGRAVVASVEDGGLEGEEAILATEFLRGLVVAGAIPPALFSHRAPLYIREELANVDGDCVFWRSELLRSVSDALTGNSTTRARLLYPSLDPKAAASVRRRGPQVWNVPRWGEDSSHEDVTTVPTSDNTTASKDDTQQPPPSSTTLSDEVEVERGAGGRGPFLSLHVLSPASPAHPILHSLLPHAPAIHNLRLEFVNCQTLGSGAEVLHSIHHPSPSFLARFADDAALHASPPPPPAHLDPLDFEGVGVLAFANEHPFPLPFAPCRTHPSYTCPLSLLLAHLANTCPNNRLAVG